MNAVRGTFADFKTVKTRGVCQLIIEVPIESADHALTVLGGVPQAKAEQWVGIAPVTAPEAPAETQRPKGGERARRAGILCNNPEFQEYMRQMGPPEKCFPPDPPSHHMSREAEEAREILLQNCFVGSMRHLDHDDSAARSFEFIELGFRRIQHGQTNAALMEQRR